VLFFGAFVGPVDFLVDFAVEFCAAFQGLFFFEDLEGFVGEDFECLAYFFTVGFDEVEADVEEFVDDFCDVFSFDADVDFYHCCCTLFWSGRGGSMGSG
jgi:hypothetical protein